MNPLISLAAGDRTWKEQPTQPSLTGKEWR